MAYSAPTTRATGFLVTAAVWNQDVVDNVAFLANPPACRVYHNTTQALTDGNEGSVTFNSERFDTAAMHSTGTNPGRITIPTAGLYVVGFTGTFEAANDYVNCYAMLRMNGSTYIAMGAEARSTVGLNAALVTVHTVYKFAASDYVEVRVMQNNSATATRNLTSGANFSPEFYACWAGLG